LGVIMYWMKNVLDVIIIDRFAKSFLTDYKNRNIEFIFSFVILKGFVMVNREILIKTGFP